MKQMLFTLMVFLLILFAFSSCKRDFSSIENKTPPPKTELTLALYEEPGLQEIYLKLAVNKPHPPIE